MSNNRIIYGDIITMNKNQPNAEAMAIKDGKITFIGSKADAQKFITKNTEVIDFGNKNIYPSFIDVHGHMGLLSTVMLGGPTFKYASTYEDNVKELTEFIKANPGRDIYKAYGFTMDVRRGYPTHEMLDNIEIDGKKFAVMIGA